MFEVRPYTKVKVGFNQNYSHAWATYSSNSLGTQWIELGDLLAFRAGWHCDVINYGELLWNFGTFNGSILSIQVLNDGKFRCFEYYQDESQDLENIDAGMDWINEREENAR